MPPAELPRSIAREVLNELPIARYAGEVRLAQAPEDLARALEDIRAERVAGFDTETRPAFRPGESYPPALAQIATANAVYLWPLARLDCSAALAELLGQASLVKAGVSMADDLKGLRSRFAFEPAFEPHGIVDLGHAARRHGFAQTGVRNLAGIVLGVRIPKGAKTSNWAAQRLSAQQIAYAATDAWICRELYLAFEKLGLLNA
jgi:ribonuclease D